MNKQTAFTFKLLNLLKKAEIDRLRSQIERLKNLITNA